MSRGEITREPIAEYHSQNCVSHSRLEIFRDPDRGPARYHGRYIARTIPDEAPTGAMDIGQSLDALLLEKKTVFVSHPRTYKGPETAKVGAPLIDKPWNWNANVCKDWAVQQQEKIILSPYDEATVHAMHAAVMANPIASALLTRGEAQISFRFDFGRFKVQVRPDWWNKDGVELPNGTKLGSYIVDLKTADDAAQFEKNRRNFGYDRQAALYSEIVRMVLAEAAGCELEDIPEIPFFFVVVYKNAPVQCAVTVLDKMDLTDANGQVHDDLRGLKRCYESGEWPGVPGGIITLPSLNWKRLKNPEYIGEPAFSPAA